MLLTRNKFIFGIAVGFMLTACGSDSDSHNTKVFKPDASIQCEDGGISPDEMRLELASNGIDVLCAQKAHDGMAYPTVCGGASGNINVFEIRKVNVPDAEKLGFKPVSELPDYQDKRCTQ